MNNLKYIFSKKIVKFFATYFIGFQLRIIKFLYIYKIQILQIY